MNEFRLDYKASQNTEKLIENSFLETVIVYFKIIN